VLEVPKEGPSHAAGLLPNDRLLKIDGVTVEAQSLDEVHRRLSGEVGSSVELLVARGDQELALRIQRAPYRKSTGP
jgi:carboxyl-terminal processing protease